MPIEDFLELGKKLPWSEQEAHFSVILDCSETLHFEGVSGRTILAELYFLRGTARRMLEKYSDSLFDYEKALEFTPGSEQRKIGVLSLYLAECLLNLDRDFEAVPYLKTFLNRIADGSIPADDFPSIRPEVRNIWSLYQQAELNILGFKEVVKKFD